MNPLKRKAPTSEDNEQQRNFKIPRVPQPLHSAGRPVIKMILEDGTRHGTVMNVLLDTGCTTPLIDNKFAKRIGIPCFVHQEGLDFKGFNGQTVEGAGKEFTVPLTFPHHHHYSKLVFEVAPLEPNVDLFLPCWWQDAHEKQGKWLSPNLRFESQECLKNYTKAAIEKDFSLDLDDSILFNPEARLIGHVSATSTIAEQDPLSLVPPEFRRFLGIMGKEAADALPAHTNYDHRIDLKDGEKPPWGPIYLSHPSSLG